MRWAGHNSGKTGMASPPGGRGAKNPSAGPSGGLARTGSMGPDYAGGDRDMLLRADVF